MLLGVQPDWTSSIPASFCASPSPCQMLYSSWILIETANSRDRACSQPCQPSQPGTGRIVQHSNIAGDVQIPACHPHQQDVALVPSSEEPLLAKGMNPRSFLLLPRSTRRLPLFQLHTKGTALCNMETRWLLGYEESLPSCQVQMHNLLEFSPCPCLLWTVRA